MLILVTGATGNVGRHVVNRLLEAGVQVRALTRSPDKANLPAGVQVVRGDLGDLVAVREALRGVDRLFLFPVDGTATGVMDAAREAGVSRVVVLSSVSAAYGESDLSGDYHRAVEVAVEESGIPWTHIRPGEFMMNLLDWAPSIAAENVVRAPFADQESNAVHEADIADLAAVALLHDGHEGHAYEVNGPETLTRADQAQVIGTAIGRDVRFVELTRSQAREQWLADGMDLDLADWLLGPDDESEDHGEDTCDTDPAPTSEAITGRPARTLHQWALEHAQAFTTQT